MHSDLATRRRVLVVMCQRYVEADRNWNLALHDMKTWFPTENQPHTARMGDPGSPIRRLYEQRKRAVFQLEVAQIKLDVAKQRLAEKLLTQQSAPLLCLTYARTAMDVG